jgi:hypothetical protein
MFKEMPVIPDNRLVDPKRIIGIKRRSKEEERHKGSLSPPKILPSACIQKPVESYYRKSVCPNSFAFEDWSISYVRHLHDRIK